MPFFLMPFTLILLVSIFKNKGKSYFDSLSFSLISIALYVLLITNLLSIFNVLTSVTIKIAWIIPIFLLLIITIKNKAYHNFKHIPELCINLKNLHLIPLIVIIICISFLSLLYAYFTVPNNWDSMTYHLARVAHWINNKSVNYYYTGNTRQLLSPVLDEYFLLNIMLLSGNDKYVNLLQWSSYIISALYIWKIARMLGCSNSFALIGSLLFMTMPIAFAESMTTQNDLFATMWLCIFLYKIVIVFKKESFPISRKSIYDIICMGILIGIGYLAKTSVCIPMFYFTICLVIYLLFTKKVNAKDCCIYSLIAASFCAAVIAENFIRWKCYGSIDTSGVTTSISINTINPLMLLLNLYKNISSLTVYSPFSAELLKLIGTKTSNLFNLDINNSAISFGKTIFTPAFAYNHDTASVYIVTILGCISFLHFLFNKNVTKSKKLLTSILFIGFLTIPVVLRWQPWGTRIMLPCASLLCILISLMVEDVCSRYKTHQGVLVCLCTICLITFYPQLEYHLAPIYTLLKSGNDRFSLYFYNRPQIYNAYRNLIEYCESLDSKNIALCAGSDSYVYPFLHYFKQKHNLNIRETPLYDNVFDINTPAPDYIACIETSNGDSFIMKNCMYEKIYTVENYYVYKKQ